MVLDADKGDDCCLGYFFFQMNFTALISVLQLYFIVQFVELIVTEMNPFTSIPITTFLDSAMLVLEVILSLVWLTEASYFILA